MKNLTLMIVVAATMFTAPAMARESDAQVSQRLIRQSIAVYPGSCACPYSTARNGSRCGGRSAWSRGGGYAPLCFASDVGKAAIAAARR